MSMESKREIPAKRRSEIWKGIRAGIKRQPLGIPALRFLQFLLLVALLADFLANDKPFTAVYKGERHFPILKDYWVGLGFSKWEGELVHADWKSLDLESAWWPPVRWGPNKLDTDNGKVSPFGEQKLSHWKNRHYLGTHVNGKDVLSGLIHGTRISLTIGLLAVGIAGLIGISLGAVAGYFGDHRLKISRIGFAAILSFLPLAYFYGFHVRFYAIRDALSHSPGSFLFQLILSVCTFFLVLMMGRILAIPLERIPILGRRRNVPLDMILSRIMEIVSSIPVLLLLLSILVISKKQSIYFTMILIGLISWAGIGQLMRAEMLRIRQSDFIQSARSLGFSEFRTIFLHALPNSISSVLVLILFGIAGAITLESGLSFLGIGIPDDTMTWGKILQAARFDIRAWWLTVFPGAMIFLTITAINLVGEGMKAGLEPKLPTSETESGI